MMKGLPYVNFSKHQLAYFTYHRDNITNMTEVYHVMPGTIRDIQV